MNNNETLLSKWHLTESCRKAYERANRAKSERIAKLKQTVNARREQLERDVEEWSKKDETKNN